MNGNGRPQPALRGGRSSPRVYCLREIEVSYEGRDEHIVVKPPNLSLRGMFVNTARSFPEGAVLNLRFVLALTGAQVETRGEVRYCEPGVGVGVEFINLSAEAAKVIEREIELNDGRRPRTAVRPANKRRSNARSKRGR